MLALKVNLLPQGCCSCLLNQIAYNRGVTPTRRSLWALDSQDKAWVRSSAVDFAGAAQLALIKEGEDTLCLIAASEPQNFLQRASKLSPLSLLEPKS